VEFYNKNFLLLAGFEINTSDTLEAIMESLVTPSKKPKVNVNADLKDDFDKVLLAPSQSVDSSYLNRKHIFKRDYSQNIFEHLERLKLGSITKSEVYGPKVFTKASEEDINKNFELSSALTEIGVGLSKYASQLKLNPSIVNFNQWL
jgi:hypothetical protein